MKRRIFLRSGLAAVAAPGILSLPGLEARALDLREPARRRRTEEPIRLSSNENPLGMPESARRAIVDAMAGGSRYPQLDDELAETIARKHGVRQENVVLGAGSSDVLRMAVQTIVTTPGARLVVPEPTFEQVETYASAFIDDVARVPLRPDHSMDLDAMRTAAMRASGETLVFVCNPNNPTGTITSCDDIEGWIRSAPERILFLIDEAYFDFVDDAGYRTLTPLITRPNVIVSRTFSKIYGLAGLRVGYGLALPQTVRRMRAFALANATNHFAQVAALACISDEAYMRRSIEVNRRGREIVRRTLAELELAALPSHTNFVMHRIKGEVKDYNPRMLEAGLRVGRAFPPMLDHSRVSIGLPEQMEVWADALRGFRSKGWV